MKCLLASSLIVIFLIAVLPLHVNAVQKQADKKGETSLTRIMGEQAQPKIKRVKVKIENKWIFWKEKNPGALIKQGKRLAIVSLIMIPLSVFGGLILIPIFAILSLSKIKKAKRLLKNENPENKSELLKQASTAQALAILGLIAFSAIGIAFLNWLFNGL